MTRHVADAGGPVLPAAACCSTYAMLKHGAGIAPQAPALSFFLRVEDYKKPWSWTHREWLARITQAANLFRGAGAQRNNVIAIVLPNLPDAHWALWGAETAGIAMPINPLLEPAQIRALMQAAEVRYVVTLSPTSGTDIWQKVSAALHDVPSVRRVWAVEPTAYLRGPLRAMARISSLLNRPQHIGAIPVDDFNSSLAEHDGTHLRMPQPQPDDIASYFCTGGTTGLPKIAIRTHRTETSNASMVLETLGETFSPAISVFCGLPLFHVNGQIGTGLVPWAIGAHVVLGTPQGYRAPGLLPRFWEIAERYRIGSFSGVPTVYAALMNAPREGRDLSSLKMGICGAAPMPPKLFRDFEKSVGIPILEGYGLTEAGCVSSLNPPAGERRIGSIGKPVLGQDMAIVILADDGSYQRDAAVGEPGVVAVQGPNLFAGYLEACHNDGVWIWRTGEDGKRRRWLNTGDLGRKDAEGYFWLVGRKKELIIRGGHNIDPKSIEEPLMEHPAVALAAAIGRPDSYAGEIPVAYVQLKESATCTEGELEAFATQLIAERAAVPKHVRILASLPTTAVGKVFKPDLLRREIRSVVEAEAQACGAELSHVSVVLDSQVGMKVLFQTVGDSSTLQDRLGRYAFVAEPGPANLTGGSA